ncbi:TetR/AcrR family transcriptional regulator [Fictibacillus sp. NRS-1165]|uniref:TetR/AcrR family transcriptional regulator n=1 Tax=Fictibacillus sp. NRS-1165 TaxID=3144463 RepID=UPI003D1D94B6
MLNHHQKQSQETISKLIRSGIELFSKQGYSSTSIDEVVKHAGYSKGGFYAHFANKEEFLMKIIRSGMTFYFEELEFVLNQENRDLLKGFKEYSLSMATRAYGEGFSPMFLQACMISNELPQIKERLIFQMEEWRQFMTLYIQEMKDEGIVGSALDARTLATSAMAIFNGFNLQHFVDERIDPKGMVETFLELLQIQEPTKKG